MFPAQTLRNTQISPFAFPQQLQCTSRTVKVFLGNSLEHLLWELDVAVLVVFVRISVPYIPVSRVTRMSRAQPPMPRSRWIGTGKHDIPAGVVDRFAKLF